MSLVGKTLNKCIQLMQHKVGCYKLIDMKDQMKKNLKKIRFKIIKFWFCKKIVDELKVKEKQQ